MGNISEVKGMSSTRDYKTSEIDRMLLEAKVHIPEKKIKIINIYK